MKILIIIINLSFVICHLSFASIVTTKHNLSSTGPGRFKAASETEICIFCHVPHGASPAQPLWNHASTVQSFTPYDRSVSLTLRSNPGQPDGASKLCLSCHDGTVAVGATGSAGTISGLTGRIEGRALLGTNLSASHPVSFVYDNTLAAESGELINPAALPPAVKLDAESKLQCTSCHNPHDDANGKFLVAGNSGGALCAACHSKSGWSDSIHRARIPAGCNLCHKPHGASAVPLLSMDNLSLCGDCHGAQVAEFNGTSVFSGAGSAGSYTTVNSHHDVPCGNCHNPHAAKQRSGTGGAIEPLIDPFNRNAIWSGAGATDYRGSIINFCLSCHGGSFPNAVANPAQTIAPLSSIINIASAYLTDRHGSGSVRPTASNTSPAVPAMACTACHGPHGSHYTDQTWDGNVYNFNNVADGTVYADNGAETGRPLRWPYVAPTASIGISKSVRVSPTRINNEGDTNNLNNLCSACHSVNSGPRGTDHGATYRDCTSCHHHGNPISAGGL